MYTETTDEYAFARSYLTPGEAILWKGKPGKGHLVTSQDVFMIPFSIFWCGFAIFWLVTAVSSGAPVFFWAFGIPFVCVGLYLVFGRFIWTAYIRKKTNYVVTNKKIIRKRGSRVDMLDGKTLPPMQMNAYNDGSGTIRFGEMPYYYRRNTINGYQSLFALENIPNVVQVHSILSQIEK